MGRYLLVNVLVPVERVERLIHLARGEKVLLDADLARLYGVETKALNRAVKRNRSRFPQDFMFQLTAEEAVILRCQIGTSRKLSRIVITREFFKVTNCDLKDWGTLWGKEQNHYCRLKGSHRRYIFFAMKKF